VSKKLTLRAAIKALRECHGAPQPLTTADPFELVLWENVALPGLPPGAQVRSCQGAVQRTGLDWGA
jgi:hypothetical protein